MKRRSWPTICVRSRKCGPCWSCRTSPLPDTPGTRRFHPRTGAPLPRSDGKHEGRFPGPQNIPDKLSGPPLLAELRRRSGQTRVTLYGGNPLHGTDRAKLGMGLLPVMEMAAPVLSVHPVVKGATVSYGCLYTAPKDIRAAVVGGRLCRRLPAFAVHARLSPDPGTARPYPWAGVYADVHRRRDRYPGRRTRRYGLSAGGARARWPSGPRNLPNGGGPFLMRYSVRWAATAA